MMRFTDLIRALIVIVAATLPTLAAAVETFLEVKPDGIDATAWREAQENQSQRLLGLIGTLPQTPVAAASFTADDAASIAEENASGGPGAPYAVGVVKPLGIDVRFDALNPDRISERPTPFAGGLARLPEAEHLAWATRLDIRDTGGARLRLDDVQLPKGAELYVYNDAGDVRGPYTGSHDSLWLHSIGGNSVFVQLDLPRLRDRTLAETRFRIGAVLVFDPSPQAFCPDNASCIEDGSCFDGGDWPQIDNVRKAVANMLFVEGGQGYICTGGLLTDTDSATYIPYFLTANHCISSDSVAQTLETRFGFETDTCGGACFWPGAPTTSGATLLHASSQDDHSLLRLDEDPPAGSVFLGWTDQAVATTNGTMLYRLSHPKGSPQAYSTHQVNTSAGTCVTLPRGRYIYSTDQTGATEGGSSGSPVMNVNAQVVGQLFGACGTNLGDVCDSASNSTVDGAFANYLPDVAQWLDPDGDPGSPCPATLAASGLPARGVDMLSLLDQVRDEVLPGLAAGDWMKDAFYRNATEVSLRLLAEPSLRVQASRLLQRLRPELEAAVANGDVYITVEQRLAIARLARELKRGASTGLHQDLAHFLDLLSDLKF